MIREEDASFYEGLQRAGFLLDFGEPESGVLGKLFLSESGFYIDVGASQLIIDGKIKLRSGVSVKAIRPQGVLLSDDSELHADLIVYATGYKPLSAWVAKLISPEVAEKVGQTSGLRSETAKVPGPWQREVRNMWKPTAQKGLWFTGANFALSRFYSQHAALQIKARMEGLPTPIYR